ncbi:MAG: winged helix-turn-helix transcriptional regulator [Methanobacteriaceae archaeon]|jgi:putative transcriptional regulator|nr:winged helix-turn-helix transcriptional regulator [Candidatus Methanorudis spinitermitis]
MKIFKKRGEMTHFQILSEISKQDPHLRQKDIAERLNITVQAVSENIKTLVDEGYINSRDGRSPYKITQKGIVKVKKDAINLRKYSDSVLETMNHYKSVWPAIACEKIKKNEQVGLYMEDGILYADKSKQNATASVLCDADVGEDLALTGLNGVIDLEIGQVIIISLPTIKKGGSRSTDLKLIEKIYEKEYKKWGVHKIDKVGIMGTIARVVANKLNIPIAIEYATAHSTVAATKKGLNIMVLAVGNMAKTLIKSLEEENIKYNIIDASKKI